jgi:hypothetical protein
MEHSLDSIVEKSCDANDDRNNDSSSTVAFSFDALGGNAG